MTVPPPTGPKSQEMVEPLLMLPLAGVAASPRSLGRSVSTAIRPLARTRGRIFPIVERSVIGVSSGQETAVEDPHHPEARQLSRVASVECSANPAQNWFAS